MPGAEHINPFDPHARLRKVDKIFNLFDANRDGYLNRREMAALVMAVNPRVQFTEAQINAILSEVFRSYGEFIAGDKGLRQDGLLRTYNDGAGDVDRDFESLGLKLDDEDDEGDEEHRFVAVPPPPPPPDTPAILTALVVDVGNQQNEGSESSWYGTTPRKNQANVHLSSSSDAWSSRTPKAGAWPPSWTASPNNGITYADTWHIVEDLDTLLRRAEAKRGISDSFIRALQELCQRADCSRTQDEAFDAHMAMGRSLFDHGFFEEALARFQRATELRPTDVRPYFRSGNSLCSLSRFEQAVDSYKLALDAAHSNGPIWSALLPQIHVNLGVSLEEQGMLLCASEHYREAAILNPSHYRALKLLGSALLGLGEYRAAEKALGEALVINNDYADAHCDLGSVLHAVGESGKAVSAFNRAIQLEPQHKDALYNLGGCLRDCGSFSQAVETYSKILALDNTHWQAHLNKAVSLLGLGDVEQATESMKQALKLTNRVELFDELKHLECMQTSSRGLNSVVTPVINRSRFLRSSHKTTSSMLMRWALEMRAFQKHTRFNRCDVSLLTVHVLHEFQLSSPEQLLRKADVEEFLRRKLFPSLSPTTFQGTIKSVNERILNVLDSQKTGKLDIGMLLALLAPVCSGPLEIRKRVAFDLLVWRERCSKNIGAEISRAHADMYFRSLTSVYMPPHGRPDDQLRETSGEDPSTSLSFPEFLDMFEDSMDLSFSNILETLMKLETGDRTRHNGVNCSVCSYEIVGPRFKEVSANFNLCSVCYSECKVPADMVHEEYFCFKEYGSSLDVLKEKLFLFGFIFPTFN